jgi:glycosyltransferase involved in cell wall biosynthesis
MSALAIPGTKKSKYIITPSEYSKKQLVEALNLPPEKIKVIPNGPKKASYQRLSPEEVDRILAGYGVDVSVPFGLHVGVMEKRKNLIRLVNAFSIFLNKIGKPYQLLLVGQPGPKRDLDDSGMVHDAILKLGLDLSIKSVGYVPDTELPAFYQKANFFVFPSLEEGFGIPVLEAFYNKVPVVAANRSAIPEIAANAALLFDPFDCESISNSMIKIASDEKLRSELIELGSIRAREFSWKNTAEKLSNIFTSTV